jgi:hypothetical protein
MADEKPTKKKNAKKPKPVPECKTVEELVAFTATLKPEERDEEGIARALDAIVYGNLKL